MTIFRITLTAMTIFLLSCGGSNERPKTAEELKAELRLQEFQSPTTYLEDKEVKLKPQQKMIKKGGLFRAPEYAADGAIIYGNLINKATIAKFKDIVVKISFYSQTKTLIKEESYVLYEYFDPNSTKPFSMKIAELPQAYDAFGFEVMDAKPVYE